MHTAASEQWLYDTIPGIVETLNAGADNVVVSSADKQYETTLSADTLAGAVAGLYQPVINAITARELAGEVTTVMFSARVANLPGLMAQLQHNPAFRVMQLPPLAVPKNILQESHAFVHDDEHLSLILQRPWQASPSLVTTDTGRIPSSPSRVAQAGTHVLVDALAYPVSDEALMLGTSLPANQWGHQVSGVVKGISRQHCLISQRGGQVVIDDKSTYGTFVNGKRVSGSQALNVGDRVQIGNPGIEVRIIRQVDSDGQA
ncbi:MAG: FHA domain-containing protein [Gammaproteobacteria bacterium]|nr:FHA domain-containing protein [Gammaproteobacteria bacterium]